MAGHNRRTSSREMHSNTPQKESTDGTVTEVIIHLWTFLVSLLFSRLTFFSRLIFFTKEETKKAILFFSLNLGFPN